MAVGSPPTVRRRQLGRELRRLREESGLRAEQLAERLHCSASRVSRIETARIRIAPGTVHEILDALAIHGPERDELVRLAWEAEAPPWLQPLKEAFSEEFAAYLALEWEAARLRFFEGLIIHGLLQTEDYTRALLRYWHDDEQDLMIESRKRRQERLTGDDPVELWVIFDEAALRRQVGGPEVMKVQRRHLLEVGDLPNVTIQVIPFSVGVHANLTGPFGILQFRDPQDPGVVYAENATEQGYVDRPGAVASIEAIFERLTRDALSAGKTRKFIRDLG